jgi:hypothetical protein
MAQKRTDYSKFTQPNGTIQVLMLWASVALHLVIGSNLGLFGRLDPIKVKPAGGTVRVVDLTPAEQTRVPEAAKSRPLPIAPSQADPEPSTRKPLNDSLTFSAPKAICSRYMPSAISVADLRQILNKNVALKQLLIANGCISDVLKEPNKVVAVTPKNDVASKPSVSPSKNNRLPTPQVDKNKQGINSPIVKPSEVFPNRSEGSSANDGSPNSGISKRKKGTDTAPEVSIDTQNPAPASPRSSPTLPNSKPSLTPSPKSSPNSVQSDGRISAQEQEKFINDTVRNLAIEYKGAKIIIDLQKPLTSVTAPYQQESSQKITSFVVVIVIKDDGSSEGDEITYRVHPPDKLAQQAIEEGQKQARNIHRNRSISQKSLEKEKTIMYPVKVNFAK